MTRALRGVAVVAFLAAAAVAGWHLPHGPEAVSCIALLGVGVSVAALCLDR